VVERHGPAGRASLLGVERIHVLEEKQLADAAESRGVARYPIPHAGRFVMMRRKTQEVEIRVARTNWQAGERLGQTHYRRDTAGIVAGAGEERIDVTHDADSVAAAAGQQSDHVSRLAPVVDPSPFSTMPSARAVLGL